MIQFSKKTEKIITGGYLAVVIIILSLFYPGTGLGIQQAIGKETDEELVVSKQIKGQVSGLTSKYITIIYSKDKEKGVEKEFYLYLSDDVEIVHKRSLKEILPGDTVKIAYEERSIKVDKVKDDGSVEQVTKIISRKVKRITLIKSAIRR